VLVGPLAEGEAQPASLAVVPSQPGRMFDDGAIGLSIETEELATRDLSAGHGSLVALMRLLGPGVLRIGGNSLDRSWWTTANEVRPPWATSVVTPADLVAVRDLLAATGWHAILGVDLGHFDPARAADEAQAAESILGSRLLGLELGNEPDDYSDPRVRLRPPSYSVAGYLHEVGSYRSAIRNVAPGVRFYGPDLSAHSWLSTIAANKSLPFVAITHHYYPISYSITKGACKATPLPAAADLLSGQVRENENTALTDLVAAGRMAHRSTRISETNNTGSCDVAGGPDTSPVFASALWALDWSLRAASAGVTGLNFHGYFGRCFPHTFSPICASSDTAEAEGEVAAKPEYYGLLAARQLEGGRFVPVRLTGLDAGVELAAYATVHRHGVLTIAIDDFISRSPTTLSISAPGYHKATYFRLSAPSISSTVGVTFGRGTITAGGAIRLTATRARRVKRAFRVALNPTSAVVVTLRR
jgi:hypothetical protein